MNKIFTDNGWKDYVYWQTEDRKTLKKINNLLNDISRNGNVGVGKPEPLSGNLSGFWSRRINDKDRLIYRIDEENIIKSPLVGRFYAAPAVGSDNYVKVGDKVEEGQTLAIIEAMKLMNEIKSEYSGTIKSILVKNEELVEYGQPLFVLV